MIKMDILQWFSILLLMMVNIYRINGDGENSNSIRIIFVNDMGYSFYPVNSKGTICKEGEADCKAGLARLEKKMKELCPPPKPDEKTSQNPPEVTTAIPSSTSEDRGETEGKPNALDISDLQIPYSYNLTSNTIFLNAGNFLQSTSNWYDLLKFEPAVEALKSLNFSAIALGLDIFNYDVKSASYLIENLKGEILAANIKSSNAESPSFAKDIAGYQVLTVSGDINIVVIGFVDRGYKELRTTGINIGDPVKAVTDVVKKRKAESNQKDIFIAIGSVESMEVANEIAEIEDVTLVICSGLSKFREIKGIYLEQLGTKSKWIASTEVGPTHHLLGEISMNVKEDGAIDLVRAIFQDYMDISKTDDKTILEVEERGKNKLISIKETPVGRSQVTLNAVETCLETVWGNLVTDAMVNSIAGKSNGRVAIWSSYGITSKQINSEMDFTVEDIYNVLFTGHDENIYSVGLNAKQLLSLLEDNLHVKNGSSCTSLQISGLLVEYGDWADEGSKIQNIRHVASNMSLQELDLTDAKFLIEIAITSNFLLRTNLSGLSPPKDLGVTLGEAVTNYIKTSASGPSYVKLSPLGLRYVSIEPPISVVKCHDNAGEAVLLTLAVIVIILALGLLIWYVVIPKVRQRRGSAMPLIY